MISRSLYLITRAQHSIVYDRNELYSLNRCSPKTAALKPWARSCSLDCMAARIDFWNRLLDQENRCCSPTMFAVVDHP